jgi:glycosyltransferase involved in cell wall biosynthesis
MKDVLLRGELGDNQSCGVVNIGLCYGFEKNNVNVSIDVKATYAYAPEWATSRIRRELKFDTVIDHGLPHQMNGLGHKRPWKRCSLNFWDSDLLTKEASDCVNEFVDHVIVHSDFTKKACTNAGVTKPVAVGAAGVFTERYRKPDRTKRDKFRFIFTGVAQGRKGTQEAISAFESVLADKDDVELVVKSNSWGKLEDYTVKAKNVIRVYEEFSRKDFIEFMYGADCFICPTKGDSFMFPGLEAMASGLPLIITDFGGPTQYCNDRTGYPIKYKLVDCHYLAGHQAEPDMQHLAETILHVYNNKEEAHQKGNYGWQWAQDYWDWEHVCKRLKEDLEGTDDRALGL